MNSVSGHPECHAPSVVYRRMQRHFSIRSSFVRSLEVTLFSVFLFLSTTVVAQNDLLTDIRQNVGEVFKTDSVCKKMHDRFEKTDCSKNNLLVGYHGAVLLGMARHDANVFKKMSFFSDGKELLEKSIKVDPENIELRFLRLTIQTHMPAFLGYSENKESDKAFVLSHLEQAPSEEFKKRVNGFIKHAEEQGKL